MLKQLSYLFHYNKHLNLITDNSFQLCIYKYLNEHMEILLSDIELMIWNKVVALHMVTASLKDIKQLLELLIKNEGWFNQVDFEYIYIEILNYSVTKYNNGDISYKNVVTKVLKDCLIRKIHAHNNYINEHDYSSLVSIALRIKEFKLAKDIIISYKGMLLEEQRENVFSYNYGRYFYMTKNYSKAIEMLSKVKTSDFYYTLGINNTLLFIYYETDAEESAFNLLDAYKHFISGNDKILLEDILRYKSFINLFEELLKIKIGTSKNTVDYLYNKINKTKNISYKKWLLEKAQELNKRKR